MSTSGVLTADSCSGLQSRGDPKVCVFAFHPGILIGNCIFLYPMTALTLRGDKPLGDHLRD